MLPASPREWVLFAACLPASGLALNPFWLISKPGCSGGICLKETLFLSFLFN